MGDDDDDDARYPVVLHDDLLIPHWKEFIDAIQLHDGFNSEKGLAIYNAQLNPTVCEMLVTALATKKLRGFGLARNDFANTRDGINFAIQVAKSIPSLKSFGWACNPINSLEDARYLSEGVASFCPTVERLSLSKCCGEGLNGYEVLCKAIECNRNLIFIDLRENNIQTNGETHLSDYLATNPPLKKLHLEDNNLNDDDAALMHRP